MQYPAVKFVKIDVDECQVKNGTLKVWQVARNDNQLQACPECIANN
jgi:hypothetical protein